MVAPPELDRRVVEALLAVELPRARDRRLVLVHGRYADGAPAEFAVKIGEESRRVRVTDQQSVLGVVDAWQTHREQNPDGDDVLVVTTAVEDAQLGWDVRAHAVGRSTRTVDRVEIVKQRFGAADVDLRIRREGWLVDALLAAEPTAGWPRTGPVLTRDAAVRALLRARLGLGNGTVDVGMLLEWSQTAAGPARFAALSEAERAGLTGWLSETVGGAAAVLAGLAAAGRSSDAMALGVIATVLDQPNVSAEAALAFGGVLGGVRPRRGELRAFTDTVEGTLERWVAAAESGGPHGEAARRRVLDVVQHADGLAADADLTSALEANPFLPSGFRARLRALAAALSPTPDTPAVATAAKALDELRDHRLARLHPERRVAAEMAVRLMRWLAGPPPRVDSVAGAVADHVADWGWVDRALTAVWAGESAADPVVGEAYRAVFEAARRAGRGVRPAAGHLDRPCVVGGARWRPARRGRPEDRRAAPARRRGAAGHRARWDEQRGRRRSRRAAGRPGLDRGLAGARPPGRRRRGDPLGHPGEPGEPAHRHDHRR
jgi:hypothetical protein